MEENEHEERTDNQSRWIHKECRTCQHRLLYHYMGEAKGKVMVGHCNYTQFDRGFCACTEFLPSDNLDYIELLAKRKGFISDKEDKK